MSCKLNQEITIIDSGGVLAIRSSFDEIQEPVFENTHELQVVSE